MLEQRVLLVDFNHLAFTYAYGMQNPLTYGVQGAGGYEVVDTTVQNGVVKAIHRWSRKGYDIVGVCMDRPTKCRKEFFDNYSISEKDKEGSGYKGDRGYKGAKLMEALESTTQILKDGGVSCYYGRGYEADDLIKACIDACKVEYPDKKIDVVTNDADLVPLVDEQVSVFLRSKVATWAESDDILKNKYFQVTPQTYEEYINKLSAFKTIEIPYNGLLLVKMLRGDSADNLQGMKRKFPPRRVNALFDSLKEDPEKPLEWAFRYEKVTWEEFESTAQGVFQGVEPKGRSHFARLARVLMRHISDVNEVYQALVYYMGMCLNQEYKVDGEERKSAKVLAPMAYRASDLYQSAKRLGINIPLY